MFRLPFTSISRFALTILLWFVPANAQDSIAQLRDASALLKAGKAAEALIQLDRIRNGSRVSPIESFQLGWLYGQARKYQTAIEIFRSVPEDIPDLLSHNYAIALSYFNLGQYRKTVDLLSEAKGRGLTDAKAANLLGVAYAQLGEAEQAYASLRDGLGKDPADVTGYLNLVTLSVEYRNSLLAEKIATRGIEAFPAAMQLYVSRGAVRMQQGNTVSAREDFRRAVDLSPNNADACFFAALLEYQAGRYMEAIAILRRAARNGVADPDIHYLLAESLLRASPDEPGRALRELDRAIEIDRRSVPALVLRAKLKLHAGLAAQAILDLELARQVEPESRSVLYNLGKAYRQSKREMEARRLFEKIQHENTDSIAETSRKKLDKILVERSPQ